MSKGNENMAKYKKWTQAEIEYISNNISSFSDQELAAKLTSMTGENISYGMVRRQRRKLGAKKSRGRRKKNNLGQLDLPTS